MKIGEAVEALKNGARVARSGWNGKDMFLFMVSADWEYSRYQMHRGDVGHSPFVAMRTADCKVVPWLCSQTDLLAEDWIKVVS